MDASSPEPPRETPSGEKTLLMGGIVLAWFVAFLFHLSVIQSTCRSADSLIPRDGCTRCGRPDYFLCYVVREERGFNLVPYADGAEYERFERNDIDSEQAFPVSCWPSRRGSGIWASTRDVCSHQMRPLTPDGQWPTWADRGEVRAAIAGAFDRDPSPESHNLSPEALRLLRQSEGITRVPRLDGYAHNLISLLLACATAWSCVRFLSAWRFWSRQRSRPELCPARRYDLAGLPSRRRPGCGFEAAPPAEEPGA